MFQQLRVLRADGVLDGFAFECLVDGFTVKATVADDFLYRLADLKGFNALEACYQLFGITGSSLLIELIVADKSALSLGDKQRIAKLNLFACFTAHDDMQIRFMRT